MVSDIKMQPYLGNSENETPVASYIRIAGNYGMTQRRGITHNAEGLLRTSIGNTGYLLDCLNS